VIEATIHPVPRPSRVLLAQLHLIAANLRRPALVAAGLIALGTMLLIIDAAGDNGRPIDFHPEYSVLPGLLGLLFPVGVWLGEDRTGTGLFWTLPVDRRTHALLRVAAGWAWLMGVVALFGVWLLTLALVSGGNVSGAQTRLVLSSFAFGVSAFDPSAVQRVQLTPTGLFWLVPFTAATAVYLFANALALGTRHPVRWIAASTFAFFLIVGLADAAQAHSSLDRMLDQVIRGPYGIDALLTARTESLQVSATLTTGESVVVWRALPNINQWAIATALWISIGAVLLWSAASRHREHRRG
jgi:hypothetical protein